VASVGMGGPSSGPLYSAQALPAVAALSDGAIDTYGDTRLQRSSSKKSPQSPSSLPAAGTLSQSNLLPTLSSDVSTRRRALQSLGCGWLQCTM
jgi:hypothetical protein